MLPQSPLLPFWFSVVLPQSPLLSLLEASFLFWTGSSPQPSLLFFIFSCFESGIPHELSWVSVFFKFSSITIFSSFSLFWISNSFFSLLLLLSLSSIFKFIFSCWTTISSFFSTISSCFCSSSRISSFCASFTIIISFFSSILLLSLFTLFSDISSLLISIISLLLFDSTLFSSLSISFIFSFFSESLVCSSFDFCSWSFWFSKPLGVSFSFWISCFGSLLGILPLIFTLGIIVIFMFVFSFSIISGIFSFFSSSLDWNEFISDIYFIKGQIKESYIIYWIKIIKIIIKQNNIKNNWNFYPIFFNKNNIFLFELIKFLKI